MPPLRSSQKLPVSAKLVFKMGTVRFKHLRLRFKYTYLGSDLLQLRDDGTGLGLDQTHRQDLGRTREVEKKNELNNMYTKAYMYEAT